MSAASFSPIPVVGSSYIGLKPNCSKLATVKDLVAWSRKTISNGSRIHCIKTWNPINNKKFETLSYLPPLSDESIARQIDYMLKNGWIPCLEFDAEGYVHRENSSMPGYYDGRYWTLWKLPMFGCSDPSQVLSEIQECKKAYPNAYIRCLAFDNIKQMSKLPVCGSTAEIQVAPIPPLLESRYLYSSPQTENLQDRYSMINQLLAATSLKKPEMLSLKGEAGGWAVRPDLEMKRTWPTPAQLMDQASKMLG